MTERCKILDDSFFFFNLLSKTTTIQMTCVIKKTEIFEYVFSVEQKRYNGWEYWNFVRIRKKNDQILHH